MTKIDASKIREFRRYAYQTDFPRITIIKLCDAYDEAMKEIEYLLKVTRKAEEMAKFYAEMPEKHIEFSDYQNMVEQYVANETNKIGYKAREFLSFLEKGE